MKRTTVPANPPSAAGRARPSAKAARASRPALHVGKQPQQARSKATVARILAASTELVRMHGIPGMSMSAIATRAKVPIGSLYKYFPSKTAIVHRLFIDRLSSYHPLMEQEIRRVHSPAGCARALRRAVFRIYAANRADPLMQDIWAGVQADRTIRELHEADNDYYTQALLELAKLARSRLGPQVLKRRVVIVNELIDSVIRLCIRLPPSAAKAMLDDAASIGIGALGIRAR
jgi:AcrR family transcriptional regulator